MDSSSLLSLLTRLCLLLKGSLKKSPYMKKYYLMIVTLFTMTCATAQEVRVPEPEFVNSYYVLTSDSTCVALPKESGKLGKHENKARKWGKLLGGAAEIVGAGGLLGAATSSSVGGVITGVKVARTASNVAGVAGTVSGLAGKSGMDVIFKGAHSPYVIQSDGTDLRLLIKGESNEYDPMNIYRVVRFKSKKKERRIQWIEFDSSLIGTDETKAAGFVPFEGHKYGNQSYLLTIPSSELEEGEYGVFYMSIITSIAIPVGTFSVQ